MLCMFCTERCRRQRLEQLCCKESRGSLWFRTWASPSDDWKTISINPTLNGYLVGRVRQQKRRVDSALRMQRSKYRGTLPTPTLPPFPHPLAPETPHPYEFTILYVSALLRVPQYRAPSGYRPIQGRNVELHRIYKFKSEATK